ncbi:MAG TPA: glycosyltransferase, partial [Alphaproteobacteria bacterium]|nr:glycosyltransferase [Alphaproteobacteria bacterium]
MPSASEAGSRASSPGRASRAPDPMAVRTLVVIPAYNEAETIEEVVIRASRHADVCVVDDASRDGTGDIVRATGRAHCIRHATNTHIAEGILDGFRHALASGYDYCVTMDAGLSHDPDALPRFIETACRGADLVLGYRAERADVPLYRRGLSWGANQLMNMALPGHLLPWRGAGLRDVTSGYRMYSRRAFELLVNARLRSRTFDFHIESLAYVFRAGYRIEEIPIRYAFTNSSLRTAVVWDAIRTCGRIW